MTARREKERMKVTKGSITITGTPAQLMSLASDFQLLAEYQDEYNNGTGAQDYRDLSDDIIDVVNKTGYLNAKLKED